MKLLYYNKNSSTENKKPELFSWFRQLDMGFHVYQVSILPSYSYTHPTFNLPSFSPQKTCYKFVSYLLLFYNRTYTYKRLAASWNALTAAGMSPITRCFCPSPSSFLASLSTSRSLIPTLRGQRQVDQHGLHGVIQESQGSPFYLQRQKEIEHLQFQVEKMVYSTNKPLNYL